ncbi:MAG: hypothetical protein WBX01_14195 [Nitrososphaeraceae archaeon]
MPKEIVIKILCCCAILTTMKLIASLTVQLLVGIKEKHERQCHEGIKGDLLERMTKALMRDIGEATAARMRPAEIRYDHRQFNKVLDRYELTNGINTRRMVLQDEIELHMNTFVYVKSDWNDNVSSC